MARDRLSETLEEARRAKGRTYAELAEAAGCHPVFLAAALHRQASLTPEQAEAVTRALDLGREAAQALTEPPMKGSLPAAVPTDPLLYRFHEITQVYGTAMKAVIHEMFGDGIMSAIDFRIDVSRKEDPAGDRVVVTYDGKFLPYRRW